MEHTLFLIGLQQQPSSGPSMWIVAPLATIAVLIVMGIFALINRQGRAEEPPAQRIENPSFEMSTTGFAAAPRAPIRITAADLAGIHNQATVVMDRDVDVEQVVADVPFPVTPVPEPVRRLIPEIFVGSSVGDMPHEVRVALGHTLIARRSGGGKSNILALIISSLLKQGVEVWYANAKYMPKSYNKATGKLELDITPMVERCHRVAVGAKDLSRGCLDLLLDAQKLVHDRIEISQSANAPDGDFPPIAIVFDELKAAQSDWRKLERAQIQGYESARLMAGEAIETLLTKGRQPQVFFITTGQDAQVQSLGASQGTMVNFMLRVAHPSLDNASLVNLMPKGITRDKLPKISSPYQWYVTSEGEMGSDVIDVVDVPLVTQPWLSERLKSVTVKVSTNHSASNKIEPPPMESPGIPPHTPPGGDEDMPENTDDKLPLVVAWLRREPDLTAAEVARRLWVKAAERPAGQGVGSYGVKAKRLLDEAHAVLQRAASQGSVTGTPDGSPEDGDGLRLSNGSDGG